MIVEERHRLIAAMDDHALGISGNEITNLRTILRNAESIDPGLPNGLAEPVFIGIAFEIIHNHRFDCGEPPDVSFVEAPIGTDFIHLPVVPLSILQRTDLIVRSVHRRYKRRTVDDGLFIAAKVDLVRGRLASAAPIQNDIQRHICGAYSRYGIACLDGDMEEPHLAQTVLLQQSHPVRIDGQPDELGEYAA